MIQPNPSYFDEAMGGFRPHQDADSAIKFALNAVFLDHRLGELAEMLRPGGRVGGLAGDPGWSIAWGAAEPQVFSADAPVVAEVESDGYSLAEPNAVMRRAEFLDLVANCVAVYAGRGDGQRAAAEVPALERALEQAKQATTAVAA